jgi:YVTN family beta-propeller protein
MQNTGVKMVDVATLGVTSVAAGGFSAGQASFGPIAASPTADLILVAADDGVNLNHYTALNAETGAQVGSIFPLSSRSAAIAFGPTGVAYSLESLVPNAPGDVDVLDASIPTVTSQFNIGATIGELLIAAVVASPAGHTPLLFVGATDSGNSYFKAINANTGTVEATVSLTSMPYGMAVSPAGDRLFISQPQNNVVLVYDTVSRALISTIAVGSSPDGLAVTPDGRFLYVANNGSNTLSKIDLTSLTVVGTITTNNRPSKVAIGPAGCVSVEPQAAPTSTVGATTTTVAVPALVESSSAPTRNSLPPTGHSGSDTYLWIALAVLVTGIMLAARGRRAT